MGVGRLRTARDGKGTLTPLYSNGRTRKLYPGRIALLFFFRTSRPRFFGQHGSLFFNFSVHFYATKTGT